MRLTRLSVKIARFLLVLAFLLPLALPNLTASAHANYVSSDPAIGSILPQAPKSILITFSEPLDPAYTRVRLVDRFGTVIAAGPGTIDPANPKILHLDGLPQLGAGTYSAIWQARSAADGHLTAGNVSFSVGQASPEVSLLPPAGQTLPSESLPSWLDVALRWASYLAASLAGGGLAFGLLVWRPSFRAQADASEEDDRQAGRLLRRQVTIGALGLAGATLLWAVSQAISASQGSPNPPSAALMFFVNLQDSGWLWLRLLLAAATGALASKLPLPGGGSPRLWLLLALAILGSLASISLTSHSMAVGGALPPGADFLHLAAMSAWFGGLPALFLAVRRTSLPGSSLVPHFSRVALTSVAVLGLTGLYSALLHISSWTGLFDTSYGITLLVKLGLFLLLFGLGAVNLLVVTPALRARGEASLRLLRLSMRTEMVLGVLLLASVGILAGTAPANDALQADQRLGYLGSYQAGGVSFDLWVAPAAAGDNELAIDLNDPRPQPAGQTPNVQVRFTNNDHDMGVTQVKTTSKDQRRFTVRGSYLSMAGSWSVEVILNTPGLDEITHDFTVKVVADSTESDLPNPTTSTPDDIAAGKAAYQANCLVCHGPAGRGDGPGGLMLNPRPADLSAHGMPGVHTDGQLYLWITNGYPGSAMPSFNKALSDLQRWELVDYIHTLAPKSTNPSKP